MLQGPLEVRPSAREAADVFAAIFVLVAFVVGVIFVVMAVMGGHRIWTLPVLLRVVAWTLIINATMFYAFAVFYLFERHKNWRVDEKGIEVRSRQETVRRIGWEEVIELQVRPFGIFLILGTRPMNEEICFVPADVRQRVRELHARLFRFGRFVGGQVAATGAETEKCL